MRTAGRGPKEPGRLKELKAIGWYVEDYGIAQISCNLTDYHVTNMHTVYEECEKDARELNISLCGGEIVGLVNLESILDVADYYIKKENLFILEERQKVMLVIQRLGLNSVSHFDPDQAHHRLHRARPAQRAAGLAVGAQLRGGAGLPHGGSWRRLCVVAGVLDGSGP